MARYMDQEIFNALVFVRAWAKDLSENTSVATDEMMEGLIVTYRKSFPTDDFESEIREAESYLAKVIDDFAENNVDKQYWLNALRLVAKDFLPNGKRRGRKVFGGIFFTAPRSKPQDRVRQFAMDATLYLAAIHSGAMAVRSS